MPDPYVYPGGIVCLLALLEPVIRVRRAFESVAPRSQSGDVDVLVEQAVAVQVASVDREPHCHLKVDRLAAAGVVGILLGTIPGKSSIHAPVREISRVRLHDRLLS